MFCFAFVSNFHFNFRLNLPGYAMIRSDHPFNTKRGGVCIYHKKHIAFLQRSDITFLNECIVGEIKINTKKCFITCLYRSPSQSTDEMHTFLNGFEQICNSIALESPYCSFILGDLNEKNTNWWPGGTNNTCGIELYNLNNLLGYTQIINEPTNFEPNKLPSCIDHIYTSQPNLVYEIGVHPSLYSTCHHQIAYAKISFKVFFPPSYVREVWHYKEARVDLINRSIESFNWEKSFENLNVNEQVNILNSTLLNIFRNFIPNEMITCRAKDPPWLNTKIKTDLRKNNKLYRKYISGGRQKEDESKLNELSEFTCNLLTASRETYFNSLGKKIKRPKHCT